jgi:hypothetical protein
VFVTLYLLVFPIVTVMIMILAPKIFVRVQEHVRLHVLILIRVVMLGPLNLAGIVAHKLVHPVVVGDHAQELEPALQGPLNLAGIVAHKLVQIAVYGIPV